jgi:hypothetical protein
MDCCFFQAGSKFSLVVAAVPCCRHFIVSRVRQHLWRQHLWKCPCFYSLLDFCNIFILFLLLLAYKSKAVPLHAMEALGGIEV